MNGVVSFDLGEKRHSSLDHSYSWRLKDGELRYRGKGEYHVEPFGRLQTTPQQIERFIESLKFLQVVAWKQRYRPEDGGFAVLDGKWWWFKASVGDVTIDTGGDNAYPAFDDPKKTAYGVERFGLLRFAIMEVFAIEASIAHVRHFEKWKAANARG